jgi:hypothetical protein
MQSFTQTELELIAFVIPLLDRQNRISATALANANLLGHPDLGSVSMPRDGGETYAFDPDELREACDTIDQQYMHLTRSFP